MTVESAARSAHDSDAVHALARLGLAARGAVWLVMGLLAVSVLFGASAQTDQGGALRAVADRPFGRPLLVVLAVGFAGLGAWRLLSAGVGHREQDGARRWAHRAVSLARGVLYVGLGVLTAVFVVRGGGQDQTRSLTGEVMAHAGGRTVVGLAGALLVGVGLVKAVGALRCRHADDLEHFRLPRRLSRPAVWLGTVGLVGRSAVFVLVGAFLVKAAVQLDARQAKGLDAALQAVAQQPYGQVLLAAATTGVLAYALWSFVEAAYTTDL